MIFTFTILQPEGKIQTFSIRTESVEESLEEIAPILLFGRTLLFASLKKSNDVLKILPIDVVENESVADYLQRLQREWIAYVESNV